MAGDSEARVVMVTGASTGLGAAIARALALDGCDLVLTARDKSRLKWAESEPCFAGRTVLPIDLDIGDLGSIGRAVETAFAQFPVIGALVNNAGVTNRKAAIDLDEADWDDVVDPNLKGTFFLTQAFARRMRGAATPLRIVNIASTHGMVGFPNRLPYSVSKAGLLQMTRALAAEWAADGITVNAVAPGSIESESRQDYFADSAARDSMLRRIPVGRLGRPAEVAAAVHYLLGPESGFVTGHTLVIDGGTTAV